MNKIYESYLYQYYHNLRSCDSKYFGVKYFYITPSKTKIDIENSILKQMRKENGFDYRILNGNKFLFTCAYKLRIRKGNNMELFLKVFTKTKEILIPLGA